MANSELEMSKTKGGGEPAGQTKAGTGKDSAPGTAPETDGDTSPETNGETGGPKGPEPTRFGDWEQKGRCTDF